MSQLLLISDPRPLDERLGEDFFRGIPECPGVYLMKDAAGNVLYVGKAKVLRQRLRSYRVANPDRMPRRHLKLVRQVAMIDFEFCRTEERALRRESKLLRALKPKYNRAGVWPGKQQFVVWRVRGQRLELDVVEIPESGWRRAGPFGGMAFGLRASVCRLIWLSLNPERNAWDLPLGWSRGRFSGSSWFDCGTTGLEAAIDSFFWNGSDALLDWLNAGISARAYAFERCIIDGDLECLKKFSDKQNSRGGLAQLPLL